VEFNNLAGENVPVVSTPRACRDAAVDVGFSRKPAVQRADRTSHPGRGRTWSAGLGRGGSKSSGNFNPLSADLWSKVQIRLRFC